MKNKEYISLQKMIEYIDKALSYTEWYTFEEFCNDNKTVDVTVFIISQVGELVKNISKETMAKYSNIEWIVIKNLRNRIIHDYEGINLYLIWDILKEDLIGLKENLQNVLEEEKD